MESLWKQPVKNLEFDADAFEDLAWWIENDRKKALKIIKLIRFRDDEGRSLFDMGNRRFAI
jgi:hypothetical protein